jgi:hypothetical protein
LEQYLRLGYSENWINQRLKSIEIRKELTDEPLWSFDEISGLVGVHTGYNPLEPSNAHIPVFRAEGYYRPSKSTYRHRH